MRIVDYVTIAVWQSEVPLDRVVKTYIADGWQPLGGGFTVSPGRENGPIQFCQTMVKYADDSALRESERPC